MQPEEVLQDLLHSVRPKHGPMGETEAVITLTQAMLDNVRYITI